MNRYSGVVLFLLTLLLGLNSNGSDDRERIIFDGAKCVGDWAISASADSISFQKASQGVQFDIEPWTKGKDGWPRLTISGSATDLSDYSQVMVEIQNPTDRWQDIVCSIGSDRQHVSDAVAQLPPGSTHTVILDLSDGVELDQSSVRFINLYLSHPVKGHSYVLKTIRAVRNPDFVSGREANLQRLDSLQRRFHQTLSNTSSGDASPVAKLMSIVTGHLEMRQPGYLDSVEKLLGRIEDRLSKEYFKGLGKERFIWTSPLGLPMYRNTLPQSGDSELKKINRAVCLNDNKAICVNVSGGATPQSVTITLQDGEEILSLKPTLFVTARDGSETADAIGRPCRELHLEIGAFETKQFILWIDTKSRKAEAKAYSATLQITVGEETHPIPVTINIADIRLPQRLPILIYNWAYFFEPRVVATNGLEVEAVKNLREYGLNTWVISQNQVPLPRLDAEGQYVGLENTERFRKVMDLLHGEDDEHFILLLGLQRADVEARFSQQEVVTAYLRDLNQLFDEYKVGKERRYVQFMDEPKLDFTLKSLDWMRQFRNADAKIRFFDNGSSLLREKDQLRLFLDLVNVYSPNWEALFEGQPQQITQLQSAGVQNLGFYRCRMSRNNRGVNIHEYYRLGFWRLMQDGMGSIGFWTYNAGHGEDVWDGTTGLASGGTVVYSKDGHLLTSRRWELFREGLSDYRLMAAIEGGSNLVNTQNRPDERVWNDRVLKDLHDLNAADVAHQTLIEMALRKRTPNP